ncbi:MAG: hypothetical protein J6J17_01325 [Bacilli bacterium]|nr:hypothetical protein [Bacilli bacterium]
MKNKNKKIKIILIAISLIILIFCMFRLVNYLRVKYAKIDITLVSNMTLEFNDNKKVSDYIESINGKIVDDYKIDSTKLGTKKVKFKFINDDNIELEFSYNIDIVDTVAPVVWLDDTYYALKNSEDNLLDKILCGDNYDSNPKCEIIGEYDLNNIGSYPLLFKATDSNNNITEKNFTLKVYEKNKSNNNSNIKYTNFRDVINDYKTDNTKIGIDVSAWQGDIDFEKIKNAGVEFIIIKVGGTKYNTTENYVDSKFKRNIEGANKYGIDVGIYFYSYAQNSKQAINDAKWIINQIKDYNVILPIAFDWEDFDNYNSYKLSFYKLTTMAEDFIKTIEKEGYDAMLYGSKNYLEQIWLPTKSDIWLAHYTSNTNYQGKYKIWQKCNDGLIDGIDGPVDIDIMYY